jgi:predicted acyltransferase
MPHVEERFTAPPAARIEAAPRPDAPRLGSLDAFRGLTVLGMLLVNNVALDRDTPVSLTHAAWNHGVHFADMVFPWFLLIVGVAIPFSAASHRKKGLPLWPYGLRVFRRALTLVLLGCLIDSSLARRPLFGLGVLQLIGCAYLVASLLYGLPGRRRMLLAAGFLVAHWAALRFLPVPGASAGILSENENFITHLNETYLQSISLRGLVSVVPTAALVLIGTLIGDILRGSALPPITRAARVLAAGLGLIGVGWLWSLDLPFSKPLWTASYVLYTGGWGLSLLGFLYVVMDVLGRRGWAFPLMVFGANAIVAYVTPILVKIHLLQEWQWTMPDNSHLPLQQAFLHFWYVHAGRVTGGWVYTASYILFWWLVLLALYRKQVLLHA